MWRIEDKNSLFWIEGARQLRDLIGWCEGLKTKIAFFYCRCDAVTIRLTERMRRIEDKNSVFDWRWEIAIRWRSEWYWKILNTKAFFGSRIRMKGVQRIQKTKVVSFRLRIRMKGSDKNSLILIEDSDRRCGEFEDEKKNRLVWPKDSGLWMKWTGTDSNILRFGLEDGLLYEVASQRIVCDKLSAMIRCGENLKTKNLVELGDWMGTVCDGSIMSRSLACEGRGWRMWILNGMAGTFFVVRRVEQCSNTPSETLLLLCSSEILLRW